MSFRIFKLLILFLSILTLMFIFSSSPVFAQEPITTVKLLEEADMTMRAENTDVSILQNSLLSRFYFQFAELSDGCRIMRRSIRYGMLLESSLTLI